jgi:hypothetical protein
MVLRIKDALVEDGPGQHVVGALKLPVEKGGADLGLTIGFIVRILSKAIPYCVTRWNESSSSKNFEPNVRKRLI